MLAKSALGRIGSFYGGGALRKPRRIVGVCRGFLKNGKMCDTFFYSLSFILTN